MSEPMLREVIFDRRVDLLVGRLGAGAVAELLRTLGRKHLIRTSIDGELERFVMLLTREMLEASGGNCLSPIPLHLVPRQ